MRIDLKTEFQDRFKVKALGARWDAIQKVWYIVDTEDLTPFMRYMRTESAKQSPTRAHSSCKAGTSRIDARLWAHTGPKVLASCGCDVLPWDDCEHTEAAAQEAMNEMLAVA